MIDFDFQPRTRVVFGAGAIARLGSIARDLGFGKTLLVADRGLVGAGHVSTAIRVLEASGIEAVPYHDFGVNPDTAMVAEAQRFAAEIDFSSMVALGGGSSMDLAKAINIVCHNPGTIADYHGYGKCTGRLVPMIAVPTTAGTGSDAQSHAIISRAESHVKMAIGDPQIAFRAAILDPELTISQPSFITAAAGYDALSHAIESCVSTRRNAISDCFAREAWLLLHQGFERVLANPGDLEARGKMLLGAHLGGSAIENSMLGAAHACANPLTAKYDIAHGAAIALTLPSVVHWNHEAAARRYRALFAGDLSKRMRELASAASLPVRLSDYNVPKSDFPELAAAAATQWTGRFNPRPFSQQGAMEIYECAY